MFYSQIYWDSITTGGISLSLKEAGKGMPTTVYISLLLFTPPSPVIFLSETLKYGGLLFLEDMNSRVRNIGIGSAFEIRATTWLWLNQESKSVCLFKTRLLYIQITGLL